MKWSFEWNRKTMIWLGAATVVCFVLLLLTGYPFPVLPGFLVCFAALLCVKAERTANDLPAEENGKKAPVTALQSAAGYIKSVLICVLGPVFTTFCIQYIILEPELFRKTKKSIWKYNIFCVAVVYMVFMAVLAEARWTFYLSHTLFVIIAFADYFVYEFRQNEITYGDLTTIGTGLSVAKNYRFALHDRGAIALMLTVLLFMLVWRLRPVFRMKVLRHLLLRAAAVAAGVMLVQYLDAHAMRLATQTWEKKGTYKNGFVLNFILGIQDSMVSVPGGYSAEAMEALESGYTKEEETVRPAGLKKGQKPVIITIMNESFSDLRLIGNLTTNEEVTPFIDSLEENTLRGYALASVFGAKTPNSEWEYLSGGSMAFLPSGSVVYQQYLENEPTTIVSTLKNEGYTTVAMHPYFSTGWRRNIVYPRMGFDEMHFMDDGYFDESRIMRDYITDEELYDKIIARFEARGEDENLYILGVTMQNHGGFKDEYENFTNDIHYTDAMGNTYADADQYLSLIHQSDIAMEKLIDYFSSVDVPVEIVFFGDHLPSLSSSFFRSLNGKGVSGLTLSQLEDLFTVPFFIWTNYDTEEERIERTSLNFLSTLTLERAGIPLPPLNRYLRDLMEEIPAMNSRGYYSLSKKGFLHSNECAIEYLSP